MPKTTITKRILQKDIHSNKYPYSEGQSFYTIDTGVFYRDINGKRTAFTEVKHIEGRPDTEENSEIIKGYRNTLIVAKITEGNTVLYEVYYITPDGNIVVITGEDGYFSIPIGVEGDLIQHRNGEWVATDEISGIKINATELKVNEKPVALQEVKINAGAGLTGGGNLSSDRTISLGTPSTISINSTNSATNNTHTHKIDFADQNLLKESDVEFNSINAKTAIKINGVIKNTNWDTAYNQRGSVIAGNNLEWSNNKLNLKSSITGNHTFQNNVVISGNLDVQGIMNVVDSARLHVDDNIILLNKGLTTAPTINDFSGIQINRGTEDDYYFGISEHSVSPDFRVGKQGALQPLLTRDERENFSNNVVLKWSGNRAVASKITDDGTNVTIGANLVLTNQATSTNQAVRADRTITAGNGLIGGGNFTANRTITLGTPSEINATTENLVTATSHTHKIGVLSLANVDFADQALLKTSNVEFNTIKGTWNGNVIGVAYGGTGRATLDAGKALIGNGTSGVSFRAITNNTAPTAIAGSTNLLTMNTLINTTNLPNLNTVGTIISGEWKGDTVGVAYGGTGRKTFTIGQILFGNGTGGLNTNANLFWNNTNSRLGVGTSNPAEKLHVVGNVKIEGDTEITDNVIINAAATNNKSMTIGSFVITEKTDHILITTT